MAAPPQVLIPGAHADGCPPFPDESAERYVMKWMTAEETSTFERHMNRCPACVQAVSEMQMFAGLLRAALGEARR